MKDKRRRPKHYDRPGKRPGFKPDAGGVIDQRAREADRVDRRFLTTTQDCRRGEHAHVTGERYCVLCGDEL